MNKETFVEIIDYENLYQISDFGRVKSLKRVTISKNGRKYFIKEKILSPVNNQGYEQVTLSKNGKIKRFSVHRLVASAFIENPKNKKCVNHKDFNRSNNYKSNLEWSTYSENTIHAIENGRMMFNKRAFGEKIRSSVLTEKDVLSIRSSFKEKTQAKLAKEFNVSQALISNILRNKIWKHLL